MENLNSKRRLRYKDLSTNEKKGINISLLNVGEVSVVYYSLEEQNQIVVQFQHTDTHMIIDQSEVEKDMKFEIILAPFNKDGYYCHVLKAFATYEDAEVSELEYISNTENNFIIELRQLIATNIKIFLIHILSNHNIILNQYTKAGEIGHSEGKDVLISNFDIDVEQDEKVDFIKFAEFNISETNRINDVL